MVSLIKPFLQLCLLNQGPQDLPASRLLLAITAFLYLLVGMAMGWPYYGPVLSLVQSLFELALLWGFSWSLLRVRRHPGRFVQTAAALTGAGAVLGVLLLPLVYAIYRARMLGEPADLAALSYLAVLGWLLVVYGHIYRHALSLPHLGYGVLVALGFVVVAAGLIESLFPAGVV